MIIGILSDTHGYFDPALHRHFADCDEIWHAGDIGDMSIIEELRAICPVVRAVCGNIDYGQTKRECPELLAFETGGVKVLLTHIGGYPGRYAKGMKQLLVEGNFDIMVCGHSHILKAIPDPSLDLLHLNPGAAGNIGWHTERTIMKLGIDNGKPKSLDIITLNKRLSYD